MERVEQKLSQLLLHKISNFESDTYHYIMGNQQQAKKNSKDSTQSTKSKTVKSLPANGNINKKPIKNVVVNYDEDDQYIDERLIVPGVDRRKQVGPHELEYYPHNCIGPLISRSEHEKCFATGFLISNCLVLTSAHTFYNIDQISKQSIKEFKPQLFYIDIKSVLEDEKATKVVDFRWCQKFVDITDQMLALHIENIQLSINTKIPEDEILKRKKAIWQEIYKLKKASQNYDYALLKLQKFIERPQYPIISADFAEENAEVTVCGLCEGPPDNCTQFIHSNTLFVEQSGGLYDIDTKSGQSGGMVYLSGEKRKVVAVHKGFDPRRKMNICAMITREMIVQLQNWVGQFGLQNVIFNCDNIPFPYPTQNNDVSDQIQKQIGLDKIDGNNDERLKSMKKQLEKMAKEKKVLEEKLKKEELLKQKIKNQFTKYKSDSQKEINSLLQQKQTKQPNINNQVKLPDKPTLGAIIMPFAHQLNDHNYRFQTQIESNKVTITYKADHDGYWYNFIKNGEIPKDTVTVFKIQQTKTEYRRIFTGIATNTIFGLADACHKSKDTIAYRSMGGKLWENTLSRNGKREIKDGETIILTVDTSGWEVKWSVNQELIAVSTIPPHMRDKGLFLTIMMAYPKDTVDIIFS